MQPNTNDAYDEMVEKQRNVIAAHRDRDDVQSAAVIESEPLTYQFRLADPDGALPNWLGTYERDERWSLTRESATVTVVFQMTRAEVNAHQRFMDEFTKRRLAAREND